MLQWIKKYLPNHRIFYDRGKFLSYKFKKSGSVSSAFSDIIKWLEEYSDTILSGKNKELRKCRADPSISSNEEYSSRASIA